MPTFHVIDTGFLLERTDAMDLAKLNWDTNGVTAFFSLPRDETHLLKVSFDRSCIVRILDEMPLSTEDDLGPSIGLIPHGFSYRVENAAFSRAQSETWKDVFGPVAHYRLITGWACLDVLTRATPVFERVQNVGILEGQAQKS